MTLRLVDTETGETVDNDLSGEVELLREQVAAKDATIHDLEKDLRAKRSQLSKLRGDRTKDLNLDPRAAEARELFELWQELLKHPRSQLDSNRMEPALDALKRYDLDFCKRAVRGMAARPYVTDRGRSPSGSKGERHDEFELIFRHNKHVERFASYADDEGVEEPRARPERLPFVAPASATPLDRAVVALRDEFGVDRVHMEWDGERAHAWWGACPIRPHEGYAPMRVRETGGHGSSVEFCCAHGCLETDLADAVRQVELRCERRSGEAVSRAKMAAAQLKAVPDEDAA